jgi:iron-sulfur cluster assembly accessory protein
MAIQLSEAATKQVKELKRAQNLSDHVVLRTSVKGGGSSGLSHELDFDNELHPHDKQFAIDRIPVVCDAKSYLYLNSTTVDYVQQGLQPGLTFVNANAKSTCGCGTSFSA